MSGSDSAGTVMGVYDTTQIPIYKYLHSEGAPHYAIADNFFQAAFGGSFLNHQWLITAATPTFPNAAADGGPNDLHSVVGPDGFPAGTPLHPATPGTKDAALTRRRIRTVRAPSLLVCRHAARPSAAAADSPDYRRPALRRGRRLGVVLRRLVERER